MREARLWPRVTNGPPAVRPVAFLGTTMLRGTTNIIQKLQFSPQNSNLMQISQQNKFYDCATFFGKFSYFDVFSLPKNGKKPKIQNFPKVV